MGDQQECGKQESLFQGLGSTKDMALDFALSFLGEQGLDLGLGKCLGFPKRVKNLCE